MGNRTSKYHNQRVTRNGRIFDSKHEAGRYTELKLLERAGKITGLKTQVSYLLIPAQYENGKRAIPFDRMVILAKYYNVSLDYLAGLIDTPRKLK